MATAARLDRIEVVRAMVAAGTYQVDLERLAARLVAAGTFAAKR